MGLALDWLFIFSEDFYPVIVLSREHCPRCKAHGLVTATNEDCDNVKPEDRARELVTVCPSVAAKCPACCLVGAWPAMCMEPPRFNRGSRGAGAVA
jgi:hypothetical protein